MKKILPVILGILLLASCATLPEPSAETRSLLVIDRIYIQGPFPNYVDYSFVFDNNPELKIYVPPSDKILVSKTLGPGRHQLTEIQFRHMQRGHLDRYDVSGQNIFVELESDTITIFPKTVFVAMEANSTNSSFLQRFDLHELTSDRLEAITAQILKDTNSKFWEPYKSGDY